MRENERGREKERGRGKGRTRKREVRGRKDGDVGLEAVREGERE